MKLDRFQGLHRLVGMGVVTLGLLILPSIASSVQAADQDTLTLRQATPNRGGAFESLYLVDGSPGTKRYDPRQTLSGITPPPPSLKDGEERTIRLFHFNDFHNKLLVPSSSKGNTRSFAQMVKKVQTARQAARSNESVLFLSAGDDHIGEVYDELLGSDVDSFVMSLPYRAYSAAGLDVATLGNHEFDKGPVLLAKMIEADAKFPLLSANLTGSRVLGPQQVHPAVIGVSHGLRIAVVGLTTPDETKTGFAQDPQLAFAGVQQTLIHLMPALKNQADLLLVLSHAGFNGVDATGARHVMPFGDVDIARYLATLGVPALVIGGHTHSVLNAHGLEPANVVDGVPIFQAGSWGSHLGEVELKVRQTQGKLTLQVASATLHALKKRDVRVPSTDARYNTLEQDSDVDLAFQSTVMDPLMAKLTDRLAMVLGSTSAAPDIGAAATQADRYTGESAIANFMNDAVLSRSDSFPGGNVDLVAFNASAIITGVPLHTQLTYADWYAVMPYADIIRVTEMSGQQIKEMVQSNAQRLVRSGETVNQGGFVSRGFLHFSKGLRYQISLGETPAMARAEAIELLGKPIDTVLKQTYRVALGDYIANGNEGWKGAPVLAGLPKEVVGFDIKSLGARDTGLVYRNEILETIKTSGGIHAAAGARKDGRVVVKP